MARPKPGLGQGLEALVTSNPVSLPPRLAIPEAPPQPVPALVRWEYALLERRKRRKGRRKQRTYLRIWFSHADTSALVYPRPTILGAGSIWAGMGLLGAEGWELIRVGKRRAHFKRPVTLVPADT